MASHILPSIKFSYDNLIFIKTYYGAPYDYVTNAFAQARATSGIAIDEAMSDYVLNAPHLPDNNGLVPPQGGTIRIYSVAENQPSRQLVDIFTQSMKQYEDPLPLRPVTSSIDALFAAYAP